VLAEPSSASQPKEEKMARQELRGQALAHRAPPGRRRQILETQIPSAPVRLPAQKQREPRHPDWQLAQKLEPAEL
jgi:hypothetical protein